MADGITPEEMMGAVEATKPEPTQDDLNKVTRLARRQIELEDLIGGFKERQAALAKELAAIVNFELPDALESCGMTEYKLVDGSGVAVKEITSTSITKENKAEAYAWLYANGFGDLIKQTVSESFGRDEGERAEEVIATLKAMGIEPSVALKVEPATLSKVVREQKKKGISFPGSIFTIFEGRQAKITRPKKAK